MTTTDTDNVAFPRELPVLPLRAAVLLPGAFAPIEVGRPRSLAAIDCAPSGFIALVLQREPNADFPEMDLHDVGCAAKIMTVVRREPDRLSVVVRGLERVRITHLNRSGPPFVASVESVLDPVDADELLLRKAKTLRDEAHVLLSRLPGLRPDAAPTIERIEQPGRLADVILATLALSAEEKQRALETFNVLQRIDLAIAQVQLVLRTSADSG